MKNVKISIYLKAVLITIVILFLSRYKTILLLVLSADDSSEQCLTPSRLKTGGGGGEVLEWK